MAIGLDIHVVD